MSINNSLPESEYFVQAAQAVKDYTGADRDRIAKAQDLALSGLVSKVAQKVWRVASQSNALGSYIVDGNNHTCACPDFPRAPKHYCKHRLAVMILLKAEQDQTECETWAASLERVEMQEELRRVPAWKCYGVAG